MAPCTKVKDFYGRCQQRSLFYSEKTDSVWGLISQTSVTPPRNER